MMLAGRHREEATESKQKIKSDGLWLKPALETFTKTLIRFRPSIYGLGQGVQAQRAGGVRWSPKLK